MLILALGASIVSTAFWLRDPTGFPTRLVSTLSCVTFAALFLAFGHGTPIMVDLHMYFFAMLAISAGWCCWRSLVVAAVFVALHHLILNYAYPAAVFPEASNLSRVLLHIMIVIVQVGALSVLINQIVRAFDNAAQAVAEAADARRTALRLAQDQERIANAESEAHNHLLMMHDAFRAQVGQALEAIRESGSNMKDTSRVLLETASKSADAAADAETVSSQSMSGVAMMASSTQELAASIEEIHRRMEQTASIVRTGAAKTHETNERAFVLAETMARVEKFVGMIQHIASQTNMLALNATIEAARAGETGRGFTVVAAAVKALATATAEAAAEIEKNVSDIKDIGHSTVQSVSEIAEIMSDVNAHACQIAAAVRQQQSATNEISEIVSRFALQSQRLADHVEATSRSVGCTSTSAQVVDRSASQVLSAGDRLRTEIDAFLLDVGRGDRQSHAA
jgi:methyl-accepting chemotaxis protein